MARSTCHGRHGQDDDVDEGDHEQDGILDEVSQRRQLACVDGVLQSHNHASMLHPPQR